MNRVRHGWIEKAFVAAEAEALAAASDHYGGEVPREADALIAGASASAIDSVQVVPAFGKLWGMRGDKRKANGLVRVLALHSVSTWLTSDEGIELTGDTAAQRLEWARDILQIFGMESDLNVDQFRLRDLQSAHEQAGKGDGLVSIYLLCSDMLRALGDTTRGPLVQAPSIPLNRYEELVISDSFRRRVSSDDIAALRQISEQNYAVCSDAYHQTSGQLSNLLSRLAPPDLKDEDLKEEDATDKPVAAALDVEDEVSEAPEAIAPGDKAAGVAPLPVPPVAGVIDPASDQEPELDAALVEEPTAQPEDSVELEAPPTGERATDIEAELELESPAIEALAAETADAVEADAPSVKELADAVELESPPLEEPAAEPEDAVVLEAPPTAELATGPEEEPELDASELEDEARVQTYAFLEDGVGIVSVFDEKKPEWRDLGLARGSLRAQAGLPLRITVNLSLRTAIDSLDDEPRERLQALDEAALAQSAGTALVPLEFEYLRPLTCPRCGKQSGLNQLQQESLEEDYHPDPDGWPHGTPAGDRVTLGCPECDFLFEVVFWFWE